MTKVKYLVLGAGPSGLTFANQLIDKGEDNFLVLEAEAEAGGLCRSYIVDGSPLDIGGGHFLDVRRKAVCDYVFRFMPEDEWNLYERDSRIDLKGVLIGHPLEANIWQLPQEEQIEYLKSIAVAGCNLGENKPIKFVDWIYWKLGTKIAEEYMIPYNQKMFGDDLDSLGTYWLEKLPNVSFEDTLRSCLNRKPYGTQPGHAQFYYPKKYGYGEVWLRMAKRIGRNIQYNQKITELDVERKVVLSNDGKEYQADYIVTTVPWGNIKVSGVEDNNIVGNIKRLKHTGVEIAYFDDDYESDAQWIYIPNKEISYHRILSRRAFCSGSRGYWTETNMNRVDEKDKLFAYNNEYAYPLNTIDKPIIVGKLLTYMEQKNIYGLGRWGEHEHYNSDVVVEKAMQLADKLVVI